VYGKKEADKAGGLKSEKHCIVTSLGRSFLSSVNDIAAEELFRVSGLLALLVRTLSVIYK